jgi:hypothetical protein
MIICNTSNGHLMCYMVDQVTNKAPQIIGALCC